MATENLIQKKVLAHLIEPYETRVEGIKTFALNNHLPNQVEIVPLADIYGPTLTDPNIDALIVSVQTKPGGDQINVIRQERQLSPLPIIEASMVSDELGGHLSSTQIRQGLVTRSGRAYASLFDQDIHFSADTLLCLKQPQGKLLQSNQIDEILRDKKTRVVLVGDTITNHFVSHQLPFNLAIIDGHSNRQPTNRVYAEPVTDIGHNPPGSISSETAKRIIDLLKQSTINHNITMVQGEEDLLAFVPSLLSPLGGVVLYGQPNQGIVMIELTESEKVRLARMIVKTFE